MPTMPIRADRHPGELATDEARDLMAQVEFAPVRGGSRSRAFAFAFARDPYAEDPWCSYQPGTFPYQADLAAMGPRPAA